MYPPAGYDILPLLDKLALLLISSGELSFVVLCCQRCQIMIKSLQLNIYYKSMCEMIAYNLFLFIFTFVFRMPMEEMFKND